MPEVTQARLKELLDYDPMTGALVWKAGRAKAGSVAGSITGGYRIIAVDRKQYRASRLVWLWHSGYLPKLYLNHINQDKTDVRIENLMEASQQAIMNKSGKTKKNKTGVRGIHWDKRAEKWCAQIKMNRTLVHIGFFKSFDNAVRARLEFEQDNPWQGWDSTSSAAQYVKQLEATKNV